MIASSPEHVGMLEDFQSVADFVRLFVLLQGGCDTPSEQPYRAVDFKAITPIGLSTPTAQSAGLSCGQFCSPYMFEKDRYEECHECSKQIAQIDLEFLNNFKENITIAAENSCFDPSLLGLIPFPISLSSFPAIKVSFSAGYISRVTRGGQLLQNTNGWIPCQTDSSQMCFGIMHIPQIEDPVVDDGIAGSNPQHYSA